MDEDQTDETIKQLCQVATRDHYDGFPNNTPLLERAPTADLLRTDAEGNVFFVQTPQRCTPKSLCEKLTRLAVNKKKHVPKQRQPPCNKHPVVKAITGTIVNKSGRDLAVRTITEDIRLRSARFSGNVTCTRIPRQVSCTDVTPDETGRTQSERRQIYFSHHYHDSTHGTILSRLDASNTMRRLKRLKIKEKKSSELDVAFVGGQISEDGVSLGRSVNVEVSIRADCHSFHAKFVNECFEVGILIMTKVIKDMTYERTGGEILTTCSGSSTHPSFKTWNQLCGSI